MWKVRELLKKRRERMQARLDKIPRKTQVVINLAIIPVLLILYYIFLGAPALSWQHHYRRIEKANLVGPGEILGHEEVKGLLFNEVVLAKTDDAVFVAAFTKGQSGFETLLYLPQNNAITVVGAPQDVLNLYGWSTMAVFAVDDCPKAVRAEMDLQLYWQQYPEDEPERPVFHLSAQREKAGYFRFDIPTGDLEEYQTEWKALDLFSAWSRDPIGINVPEDAYKATVRLYDENSKLLIEQTVQIAR